MSEPTDVSPVPPTAAGPNENVLMVNGAQAFRWTGQFYEPIPAPPVAPSEPSIYSHDENALPDNELPGMWEHADYEGGPLNLLRELHGLLSPAPSVGELEWKRLITCDRQCYEVPRETLIDTQFTVHENEGFVTLMVSVSRKCATLDDAKQLANSLQRILSGAAEEEMT